MFPIINVPKIPVDFYKDEHEEGGFLAAPTKASLEKMERACEAIVATQKRKSECKKCGGTGIIDMEFYKRKCMSCCDADGN